MKTLPRDVAQAVETAVGAAILRHESVGGGCIAHACRVETAHGVFFLKWSRDDVAQTFAPEAAGLRALRAAESPLFVPEIIAVRTADPGMLLMEWVEPATPGPGFWEAFGHGLATLHRTTAASFGFDDDNFIGRLPQENARCETWPAFFLERRLLPQRERARASGRWLARWDVPFDVLSERLDGLLPARPPASMLHGDLWSGNFLVAAPARAALVDPAAYHGHRETDLAMTELFGGFDARFYAAYREAWPLAAGYEARRVVYNLYHELNHLNHFGSGYAGAVDGALRRLTR